MDGLAIKQKLCREEKVFSKDLITAQSTRNVKQNNLTTI
jgi:hypothetical protein